MDQNRVGRKMRIAAGLGGIMLALTLASACSSGVPQKDYDALKAQAAAKDQEVASLQAQLKAKETAAAALQSAPAREPKRLEAKITIVMGEDKDGMYLANAEGVKGGPFRLPAGKTVGMHLVNKGVKDHEVMFGRTVKVVDGKTDGYQVNLFEKIGADVFAYPSGHQVEAATGGQLEEVEVGTGADAWIRTSFPADAKGEWEVACFVQEPGQPGHYQAGMKAKFIIE